MSNVQSFQAVLVTLFREAFEGRAEDLDYTWFVQGEEGIFNSIDGIEADRASQKPNPACPSIAAHAYHLLFILSWANTYRGEPNPAGDWDSSWAKQSVTEEEWNQLRKDIRKAYESFIEWFDANEDWSGEDKVIGVVANVPHVAYHLGAIRQLLQV